jgi:hypothetical protein
MVITDECLMTTIPFQWTDVRVRYNTSSERFWTFVSAIVPFPSSDRPSPIAALPVALFQTSESKYLA